MPTLSPVAVENFNTGVISRIDDDSVPRGGASDSLNWMTQGDKIELRGGYALMGDEEDGVGRITGLKKGDRFDEEEVLICTHGRKVKYFNDETGLWVETDTANVLAEDADGEDIAIETYNSQAGAFFYLSSPHSSIYKIPMANPGSVIDLQSTDYRGYIKIKRSSMFLWNRQDAEGGFDENGLYRGWIDKDELSDFTETLAEILATGDGTDNTYAGVLAQVTGKKTCMYVRITDGVETFRDDRNGVLVGSAGGTGSINYATGAYSLIFNANVGVVNITADYYTEDSTDEGIVDFSKSVTRLAGEGFSIRQDEGGAKFQNMGSISDDEYCLHIKKTWKLTLSADDENATNQVHRQRTGIPYWRALEEIERGLLYVDVISEEDPFIRVMEQSEFSEKTTSPSISDRIDLNQYEFDQAVLKEWGIYYVLLCRTKNSTINNRAFFYNTVWGSWDITDFRGSVLDEYNGTLVAGDSGSNNVFTLFSGFTDEEANIENYWTSGDDDLDAGGVKQVNRILMEGQIARDQELQVYVSLDGADFVLTKTITGRGSYVNLSDDVTIGGPTIGSTLIGGSSNAITVHDYKYEFKINSDKFEKIRIRFIASKVGYVSVSKYEWKDIRYKGRSVTPQYAEV